MNRYEYRHYRRNRCRNSNFGLLMGLLFCVAGALLILREIGILFPPFLLSWQMLLITIGLLIGISSKFRSPGFIFPILIGSFFLFREYMPEVFPAQYLLPAGLIAVGLILMIRPKRRFNRLNPGNAGVQDESANTADTDVDTGNEFTSRETISGERISETAVFANIRKMVIAKNFAGGEVSSVFGSAEINMLQADIEKEARLELNAVFGSIRLVVPPHWQIKMETTAVLGGVEDKRPRHAIYSDKILILEGNAVFGGIQIESH
jgi:predicted membrane protein